MTKTFKLLSLLLSYPSAELQTHLEDIKDTLSAEGLLPQKTLSPLIALIDHMQQTDLLELQEQYVTLFDRGRTVSLYLFEHIHGESRDRGQAMVDLSNFYKEKGLQIDASELPDYLPLFLECLSTLPLEESQSLLGEVINIIAIVGKRLKKRESAYSAIFAALEILTDAQIDETIVTQALDEPAPDTSLESLDKEWEEAAVTFGSDQNSCNDCNAFPNATKQLHAYQEQPRAGE